MASQPLECKLYDISNNKSFTLDILSITDTIGASIVKHDILNRSGALLQNLGTKARTITVKTFWYGETYIDHFSFLDYIDSYISGIGRFRFQHPKYGIINVMISDWSVMADDRQQYAEISMTMVEDIITLTNGNQPASFLNSNSLVNIVSGILNNNFSSMIDQIQNKNFGDILNKQFDITKPLSNQSHGLSDSLRQFTAEIDENMIKVNKFVYQLTGFNTAIKNTVDTIQDIPSFIQNTFINVANTIVQSFSKLSSLFIPPMAVDFYSINNIFTTQNAPFFKSAWAQSSSVSLANYLNNAILQDVQNRKNLVGTINNPTFDVNGNLIATINTTDSLISITDMQNNMDIVRSYVNYALSLNPNNTDLKSIIRQLQNFINVVQLQLLKTYQVTISEQPAFTFLMSLGKDYKEVDEFLALNAQIENPNFVSGVVTSYV